MNETRIYFYCENGHSDVYEWLDQLHERDRKAYYNGRERIEQLRAFGFRLRRPIADYLEDGIYELRWKHGSVQYRLLYFFHGQNVAILGHGITKESKINPTELKRVKKLKAKFEENPQIHMMDKALK